MKMSDVATFSDLDLLRMFLKLRQPDNSFLKKTSKEFRPKKANRILNALAVKGLVVFNTVYTS
jgi:hypothetical protein